MAQTKVSLIQDNVIVVGHLHTNHGITTGHIGEGSNLYFTDARVMTSLGSVSTHIIPDTNIAYDLGSPTNRFRDLYLSSNTIHLGTDTKITVNNDGEVEFKDSSDAPKRLKVRELDFVDDQGRNKRFKIDATSGRLATFDAVGTLTADKLDLSAMSTTDLAEGSNLYYTDARVGTYLTTNNYATQSYVQSQVSGLVASAPSTLDTLNELAAALGDDPNFATTVSNQIGGKLSSSDSRIANWDTAYGWGNHASVGYLTTVGWNDVTGKPSTFPPSAHNHDDRYYTETESDARFQPIGSYLTSYTETSTLDSVADRGRSTNQQLISTNPAGFRVDSGSYARIELDSTDNWSYVRLQDQGVTTWDIACYNSGNLEWRPGGGEANRMTLSQSGYLTINGSMKVVGGVIDMNNNDGFVYDDGSNIMYVKLDGTNREIIHSANIGSQSVAYATNAGTLDGIDSSNFFRTDGTYPNTDMNTTVEGYWHVASGSANLPVNYYGHRWDYDHVQNGQWVFQMYSPTGGDVDLWFRQKRDHSATAWQKVLTSANIGSYAAPIGGSWNGANMPGSRWAGYAVNGGEIVFQADNPGAGRMSVMVDGNFYAGESGGFWSLNGSNDYNARKGFYQDSSGNLQIGTSSTENVLRTQYGYVQVGPMNSSHAHIYTDRSNFYFNKQIQLLGVSQINQNDIRSTIFYDSNNTGYYLDPTSNSYLYGLFIGDNAGSNQKIDIRYGNYSSGYGAIRFHQAGSNNQTIHAFSTNWQGGLFPSQSAGAINISGASGVTFGGWNNPDAWVNSGRIEARDSVRGPIFYDSNNTAYFVDANNRSYLNKVTTTGINDTDVWEGTIYVDGDANTYYPVAWYGGSQSQVCEIEIHRNYSETAPSTWNTSSHKGGLVFRCSTNFGGWGGVSYDIQVQDFRETYSTMMGWMGHFANSRAFGFRLRGGGATYHVRIKGRSVGPTITYGTWDPGNNGTGLGTSTVVDTANIVRRRFASGSRLYSYDNLVLDHGSDHQTKSGILQSNSSLRAPIFYDSDNTGYFLHPDSTSYLNSQNMPHRGNGTWNIRTNDGGQENWRAISIAGGASDHIGIGVHGTSRSIFGRDGVCIHFDDTDSFRLHTDGWDTEFEVAGGGEAWLKGGLRASIYYDNNNTGYYCDPASTSNFNTVYLNAQDWGGNITWNSGVNINVSGESSFDLLGSGAIWQVWTANNSQPSIYVTYAGQTEIGLAGNRGLKVHGNLTVNHSSTYGSANTITYSGGFSNGMIMTNNTGTSNRYGIVFYYGSAPSSPSGYIRINSTSVSYVTSSDYRLKENIVPVTGAIDRLSLLKPSRFNFIGEEDVVDGFLAHEVENIVPEAISGTKDEVDEEGSPVYQGIDQSKLVPLLTAALQEAIAKIESLEARIQVLENQ